MDPCVPREPASPATSEAQARGSPLDADFAARELELAPRACPQGPGIRLAGGERARVAYRSAALARPLAAYLASAPGIRLTTARSEGETILELELGALEELAGRHPDARLLLEAWRRAALPPPRPRVMGIVNVTPDSFSDGGLHDDPRAALEHGLALVEAGAEMLDVGGESTRPGSLPVALEVELGRVLPVVEALARHSGVPISIDTTKAEVARRACDLGASWINDTSAGLADPRMFTVARDTGATFVLMHRQGSPRDMQLDPSYADPVREVADFLRSRRAACLQAGVGAPKILVDPGIGFGKRLEHNLELLRRLVELRSLGSLLLLGVSRKAFIAQAQRLGTPEPERPLAPDLPADRIGGTAAAVTAGVLAGASVLRVHDVRAMVQAIRLAQALAHEPPPEETRAELP